MKTKQPNILMVLADQHNPGWLGCAGHPQARTPRIDAFAATSVRFSRAYAQNPICTPSRISFLSGQYCHNHGYYGLSGPSAAAPSNLFRHCRAQGYRTAGFGKLHLPTSPRNWIADDVDEFGDSYDAADGTFAGSAYLRELDELGLRHLEDSFHNESGTYGPEAIHLDAMPSKLPYEHTQEVWSARRAMRFMQESGGSPFCVKVSFQRPHHPLLPQKRFWDLYPENIDLPDALGREPAHRAPHFREMWRNHQSHPWEYAKPGEDVAEGFRRAWRGTMACVSQVDDVFGMLLDFLDENGLADNTVVLYSSDHGAYHGIHGLREKAPGICSEEVCRIPLLWRAPGITRPGTVQDALVESVDVAPTLLSLCGLPPLEAADGLDIAPLLGGDSRPVRKLAVTENAWSKSVRWDQWRMVHYPDGMFDAQNVGELYNIENDPGETRNLYADPQHQNVVGEGRRLLLDWLIQTTRVVTAQPAEFTATAMGETTPHTRIYPLADGGSAPNPQQPRFKTENNLFYL
jgi:arylsulfatase